MGAGLGGGIITGVGRGGGGGVLDNEDDDDDGGGGVGRGGGDGLTISICGGSLGSKSFDSAIAARRSRSCAVVNLCIGEICRHPFTRSCKHAYRGLGDNGGYLPFTIASLLPAE